MTTVLTRSREETVKLGKSLGEALKPGDVVALSGDLGTGKTTLVIGICDALGVRSHVASPTFTMVSEYHARVSPVVHIDLYRVKSEVEAAELGIEEYFKGENICLIEWPETIRGLLPSRYIEVRLEYGDADEERRIDILVGDTGDEVHRARSKGHRKVHEGQPE